MGILRLVYCPPPASDLPHKKTHYLEIRSFILFLEEKMQYLLFSQYFWHFFHILRMLPSKMDNNKLGHNKNSLGVPRRQAPSKNGFVHLFSISRKTMNNENLPHHF